MLKLRPLLQLLLQILNFQILHTLLSECHLIVRLNSIQCIAHLSLFLVSPLYLRAQTFDIFILLAQLPVE